jgi:hypothetical protein
MDKIEAHVAIAGDLNQVVVRSDLTWPEVILMKAIHGDSSVTNIEVIGEHELTAFDEPTRLKAKYGRRYFEVWSRYDTNLPLRAPDFVPRWDDEVVVQVRQRRPASVRAPAAAQPVHQQGGAQTEQGGQSDQDNQPKQATPPPLRVSKQAQASKPKPKVPPFKPTPIIKAAPKPAPAPAPEAEV